MIFFCLLDFLDYPCALRKLSLKVSWLLGPPSLQGRSLLDHTKKIPKQAAFCSPLAPGCFAICLAQFFYHFKLQNLVFVASKAAFTLHTPSTSLPYS